MSETPLNIHGRSVLRCLARDLEVGVRDARIRPFDWCGLPPSSPSPALGTGAARALFKPDRLADNADVILGHILIDFDLPHLQAANPGLRSLQLPRWTRAGSISWHFPATPARTRQRLELDARRALEVIDGQTEALRSPPSDLLSAWPDRPRRIAVKASVACLDVVGANGYPHVRRGRARPIHRRDLRSARRTTTSVGELCTATHRPGGVRHYILRLCQGPIVAGWAWPCATP